MNNGGKPAMPCEVVEAYHVDGSQVPIGLSPADDFTARERKVMSGGMTKREMMAMHILSGMLSSENFNPTREQAASFAVGQTDALLAELERTK